MTEKLFEIGRRTFDTPHFRGIEFIEVEAKSILNKVPGDRFAFNWTINPYRGCSHACTYCVGGETPILMADGRTRPIAELHPGDAIYGTERRGRYRRYVKTQVLAHWRTVKRAHRIWLEDDTELVASGDHRFLTERGWKHVTSGGCDHPHLTTADVMVGFGRTSRPVLSSVGRSEVRAAEPALPPSVGPGFPILADPRMRVVGIEDLGFEMPMYDITTGTSDFIANGVVSHNCFARSTHTFLDMNAGRDFETKIIVKVNAPELLRKELRAKRWKGELVAMGTATDPYQRAEGRYKIMPRIIETLSEYRNPFSILTKGTLILRDLDLLMAAAEVTDVSTAFSIGTLDEDVWRRSEPGTPHPRKRVEVVKRLNEAGIPCGVLIAPVLPGISDGKEQLREVVSACIDAGATHVSPILLHLRPKVKEVYMEWLAAEYPDLVPRYVQMYPRSYAPYAERNALRDTVRDITREHPRPPDVARGRRMSNRRRKPAPPPEPTTEQLTLL
jgi:DNA repair photolyase